ncbi:MAG: hypothetical protein RLY43_1387, partial [Bacteroidota bacterium]
MAISKLKEARYLLTKAEQLEREGRLKKAQIFFVK